MNRAAWLLGLLLFGTYAFFHYEGGFNQNVRFDLTRAIVERGTLVIDAYHENTLDKAYRDGHYYADKPPGASLLGVPGYFLFHRVLLLLGVDPGAREAQRWGFYAARVTSVAVMGAIAGVVFLRAIAPFVTLRRAIVLTMGLGLATLAFPYSTVFYGHQIAATALFFAFTVLFAHRRREVQSAATLAAAGAAAAAAGIADYAAFLPAALLGLYLLSGPAPVRTAAWFLAGAVPPAVGLLAYHAICFGSPLSTGFAHEAFPFWRAKYGAGFYGVAWPKPAALFQLTVGGQRGLFYQAPWLLLCIPGLWQLIRVRRWRAEGILIAAVLLVMLAFNASLHSWEGGWTMGARYLIPAVPFLAFAAAFGSGRAVAVGVAVLLPLSLLSMLAGAAVKPEVPVLFANPLRDFLLPYFFDGKLSIPDPGGEAFNLGERLGGLRGLRSLLPLLALWTGGLLAIRAALSRRRAVGNVEAKARP
jgi:hypothetical protein